MLLQSIAVLLSGAIAITGCSVANTTPVTTQPAVPTVPTLTSPVTTMDLFTSTTAVASSPAGPVLPLFGMPDIQTDDGNFALVAWGEKDASGNIIGVSQAGVTVPRPPPDFVQVYFAADQFQYREWRLILRPSTQQPKPLPAVDPAC